MRLVVGLGNPGSRYARNRHNIGFMAVDAIARRHGSPGFRSRFKGEVAEALIAGERRLLLKPQTFMNASGESVADVAHFFKILPSEILVIGWVEPLLDAVAETIPLILDGAPDAFMSEVARRFSPPDASTPDASA